MNFYNCDCGVILNLDSKIKLHIDKEYNMPSVRYYLCPVCKKRIEV